MSLQAHWICELTANNSITKSSLGTYIITAHQSYHWIYSINYLLSYKEDKKPFHACCVHSCVLIVMAVMFTFSYFSNLKSLWADNYNWGPILADSSLGGWVDLEASRQTCVPASTRLCQCTATGAEQLAVFDQSYTPTHTHTHTPICRSLRMLRPGCRFHAETTINISLSPELKRKFAKAPAVWLKLKTECRYLKNLAKQDNETGRRLTCQWPVWPFEWLFT